MDDRQKWAMVPFDVRVKEDVLATIATLSMFVAIVCPVALIVGVPLMVRGLILESKYKGFTVDVESYMKRDVQ